MTQKSMLTSVAATISRRLRSVSIVTIWSQHALPQPGLTRGALLQVQQYLDGRFKVLPGDVAEFTMAGKQVPFVLQHLLRIKGDRLADCIRLLSVMTRCIEIEAFEQRGLVVDRPCELIRIPQLFRKHECQDEAMQRRYAKDDGRCEVSRLIVAARH